MGEIIKFSSFPNLIADKNKDDINNNAKGTIVPFVNSNINLPPRKVSELPPTPLVIETGYYNSQEPKKIVIGPNTISVEKYAFFGCITQNVDKNNKVHTMGNLEKIYLPYGIKISEKATQNLLVDYNYIITGIPSWATCPPRKIEFIIYDPQTREFIYSIEYPLWMIGRFGKDYNDILKNTFDFESLNKNEQIIFKTYYNDKFSKKRFLKKEIK